MAITDEVAIAAPVSTVWDLTVDIERLPDVTPTISSVERIDDGPLTVGHRARLCQPRQRPAVWTVTRLEPQRCFEWERPWLWLRMVGRHEVTAADDGCRNLLTLELRGRGASVLERMIHRPIYAALSTENAGFRAAAERAGG